MDVSFFVFFCKLTQAMATAKPNKNKNAIKCSQFSIFPKLLKMCPFKAKIERRFPTKMDVSIFEISAPQKSKQLQQQNQTKKK
jgi:hypothetical protein